MTRSTGAVLTVGVLAVGLFAAGCGQRGDTGASSSGTSQPGTSSAPASHSVGAAQTGPAKCLTGDLKVTVGNGDAGAGHAFLPIVFTNISDHECVMSGYPGVSFVTGDKGAQVGDPASREPAPAGTVTLAPGKAASAMVERTNVGMYDPAQCQPTDVRGLRVYPPDNTDAVFVEVGGQACAKSVPNQTPLRVKPVEPA
ncbi:MAG: DUF4232 domain-containing protein [Kutzneria sp.]|nr:DUF4232 domain-containing protein [Kutzneria sp.]MBV9846284.1 DUF4232 domain-containing protein [Kutzneria sp.]